MFRAGTKYHRPNRLDLVRRAKLLGVTHGHLSRVLSGKRQSRSLWRRFEELIEREAREAAKPELS